MTFNRLVLNRLIRGAAVVALVFPLSACGGGSSSSGGGGSTSGLPTAVQSDVAKGTPVNSSIVSANNQFGFAALQQLRSADTQSNIFISPTSLSLALSMAENGAAGTTLQAMASATQTTSLPVPTLNGDNAALQASLVNPDTNVQVSIANSLWTHGSSQVLPSFVTANQTYYGATVGDLSGAPNNINAWVNTQTNGLITQIAPSIDYSNVVAMLVNAIYFKGSWSSPFETGATQPANFTTASQSQKSVQMMTQTAPYGYYKGDTFQMVRLPYGTGRLGLTAVIPNSGTDIATVLAEINANSFATWTGGLKNEIGTISLPKFTSNYAVEMSAALKALGMSTAFDMNSADFSGISSIKPLYIQFVEHKTAIEVDEKGTVAAAATSIGITSTSAPVPQFSVRLDHPFFYAISDSKTGAILFLGVMLDPTATGS